MARPPERAPFGTARKTGYKNGPHHGRSAQIPGRQTSNHEKFMAGRYGDFADDFYVNVNLNTEMELPSQRETVLGFFEQQRQTSPSEHFQIRLSPKKYAGAESAINFRHDI